LNDLSDGDLFKNIFYFLCYLFYIYIYYENRAQGTAD